MHRLRHLFGWNTGHVYTWWDSDTGHLMIGFRCDGCATIEHVEQKVRYGSAIPTAFQGPEDGMKHQGNPL